VDEKDVLNALKRVVDPEIGINIVDMGLVYSIDVKDKSVHIKMTLTSPFCPLGYFIVGEVERALKDVGFKNVDVEIVFDPPWTPERMSEEAKRKLGWKHEDKGGQE